MLQHPQRTSSADSAADGIRKRVCKACDRCRLKKSKCDGASPCSRCKADNAICVFGERKKSHDKVYPKGYVEMLEQQQSQLVQGLQEMYRRSLKGKAWHTAPLAESNGNPLTHDLLAALDLLESKHDGSNNKEDFEEDLSKLQQRLYDRGAAPMRRRASISSESEHSLHGFGKPTPQGTPLMAQAPVFKEDWSFSASPSPISQSPMPRQRQSYPPVQQHTYPPLQQSPLHQASPLARDPQLYHHEWPMNNFSDPAAMMRSGFALKTPRLQQTLDDVESLMLNNGPWEPSGLYDQEFSVEPTSFPQSSAHFVTSYGGYGGLPHDEMQQSFDNFIRVDG